MDSDDDEFLTELNKTRKKSKLSVVSEDDFEKIIDRLEKETFRLEDIHAPPPEEDIDVSNTSCCVCQDGCRYVLLKKMFKNDEKKKNVEKN